MQKKLIALACTLSLLGSTITRSAEYSTPVKLACLVGLVSTAQGSFYAAEMNRKYSKKGLAPDNDMRLRKFASIAGMALMVDIFLGQENNLPRDLGKVVCFGLAALAASPATAPIVEYIPGLGGVLSDPIDKTTGIERSDMGAFGRGLMTYMLLRTHVLDKMIPSLKK